MSMRRSFTFDLGPSQTLTLTESSVPERAELTLRVAGQELSTLISQHDLTALGKLTSYSTYSSESLRFQTKEPTNDTE